MATKPRGGGAKGLSGRATEKIFTKYILFARIYIMIIFLMHLNIYFCLTFQITFST